MTRAAIIAAAIDIAREEGLHRAASDLATLRLDPWERLPAHDPLPDVYSETIRVPAEFGEDGR